MIHWLYVIAFGFLYLILKYFDIHDMNKNLYLFLSILHTVLAFIIIYIGISQLWKKTKSESSN